MISLSSPFETVPNTVSVRLGAQTFCLHFGHEGLRMRYVSAAEAKKRLSALLDAVQREPVIIRRQKRDIAVVMSAQEHERLRALDLAEFAECCNRVAARAKRRGLTARNLASLLAKNG